MIWPWQVGAFGALVYACLWLVAVGWPMVLPIGAWSWLIEVPWATLLIIVYANVKRRRRWSGK